MLETVSSYLLELHQGHLVDDLVHLDSDSLTKLKEQIFRFTPAFVKLQKESWLLREAPIFFESIEALTFSKKTAFIPVEQVGVILLAGGAGSRLGSSSPKGCFPLLGKSLFERHSEKLKPNMPLAVLTSKINHAETVSFFQKHRFFGLQRVFFFSQETMPLLNEQGLWFWSEKGRIAEGADGNGSVFKAFEEAGLAEQFKEYGVGKIQIIPVDNPLADPLHVPMQKDVDLIIKCIEVQDADEPMGRVVKIGKKLAIVEFAELNAEQKEKNLFANTGLLTIDLSLVQELAKKVFPLHWAWRNRVWKGEKFIVDALLYAKRSAAIHAMRSDCFAPLKEKKCIASLERLLMQRENAHTPS